MNPWGVILLIFLTFHIQLHLAQEVQLSDNPAIYDDQYEGCSSKMAKFIPRILKSENTANIIFRDGWRQAIAQWTKNKRKIRNLPNGFRDEHGIALVAYTGTMYEAFNNATRNVGTSIKKYKEEFNFKAMHYYLTTAIQMLNNKRKKLVYRGVEGKRFTLARNSKSIRFGQFTSTSVDKAEAIKFGTTSFFTMQTYLGVDLQKFSVFASEKEVLVPGYEIFKVSSYDKKSHRFNLTSNGYFKSRFNCAYFSGFMNDPPSIRSPLPV